MTEKDRAEKDRERRHRSGGSSKPGAHNSSSVDERRRKTEDRKAGGDGRHSGKSSSSKSSRRADEDRKAKDRARGSKGKGSVGAHSSSASSASDMARRKEERNSANSSKPDSRSKEGATPPNQPSVQTASLDPNGFTVEAITVDEDEANERVRKLEAQMAAMMQGGSAVANTPVVAATTPGDGNESDDEAEEEEKTFFQKYRNIIIVGAIVVVAAAVAGYFLSQKSDPVVPTTTEVALKYEKPTETRCAQLKQAGSTVVETPNVVFVDMIFEITLVQQLTDAEIEKSLTALDGAILTRLIPFFAGCAVNRRRGRQLLESSATRYMIGDATAGVAEPSEDAICTLSTSFSCFVTFVPMDFYLKGPESEYSLIQLVADLFAESGQEVLALPSNLVSSISLARTVVATTQVPVPAPTNAPVPSPTPPVTGPTPAFTPVPTPAPVFLPTPVVPTPDPPVSEPTPATPAPVGEPTMAPGVVLSATERRNLVQSLLTSVSLRSRALDWISNEDQWQPEIGSPNQPQQWIERYVMAVFYFATNGGDDWSTNTGWLEPTSICDNWRGIDDCSDGMVVDMSFGKSCFEWMQVPRLNPFRF